MKIILYKVPNTEKIMELVNNSKGDVFLELPDKSHLNLKTDATGRQMLRLIKTPAEKLSMSFPESDDAVRFMRYMTEAVCA